MNIVVLDGQALNPGDNPWTQVEQLGHLTVHDRTPDDQILTRSQDADIILTNKTPLTAETLEALEQLKFVSVLATGYNVVDVVAARGQGIPVSNVPTYGTDAVAQFTFALLLELCHHAGLHNGLVKSGEWARRGTFSFWETPLVELASLTMGIVGLGRIGRRVAEVASVLGMKVIAHNRGDLGPSDCGAPDRVTLDQLAAEADVISLHCPLTADNENMVNADFLAHMKSSAFLINTARGGLVDSAALAEALNTGEIAGAALDVTSEEPVSPTNPLLKCEKCIITPHIAWATLAARERLMTTTADNVAAFIDGKPINLIN